MPVIEPTRRFIGAFCLCFTIAQAAMAVDSSGRNSHFWITLRPQAGTAAGASADLVLANGYRQVNLTSPELTCTQRQQGAKRVYEIVWKGNNLLGGPEAETLQFTLEVGANGAMGEAVQGVTVNGSDPAAVGLVLESHASKATPRKLNGKRPPKNYFEIRCSLVLRNPALTGEDPAHPFSDLRNGHDMGPTPYKPTTAEKLKAFPKFSWDTVPRCMLIRKSTAYTDKEIRSIAENFDLVVLEKANGAGKGSVMKGMLDTGARLKAVNPDIKVLFYWNSRIFFGHYGIDDAISKHKDEWIDAEFTIRDGLPTFVRDNPEFLKWWVGCAEKMIAHDAIDGTFVDKAGVPISMLDALYQATPVNKLVMNNNAEARQRIGYVDGTYREGWSGGGDPDVIAETIAIGRETGLNQKMQILRMPVKGASSKQDVEDRVDQGLAIYLLYAEPYAYFYWQATVDAKKGKQWEWDTSYLDQCKRPLGKPLGPYVRDNRVFTRSFEHCDVFLRLAQGPGSGRAARVLWKNNVGAPPLAGSGKSLTNDTYTLQGSGEIAGKSDRFYFLSDAFYGDGRVMASVDSLKGGSKEAKAGVMFRESLTGDSKMVAMLRDAAGRVHLLYRPETGAGLISAAVVPAADSRFVMLTRTGASFVGSTSSDGKNWTEVKQLTVKMGGKIEAGMAVASHNNAALAAATFSGFEKKETSQKESDDLE